MLHSKPNGRQDDQFTHRKQEFYDTFGEVSLTLDTLKGQLQLSHLDIPARLQLVEQCTIHSPSQIPCGGLMQASGGTPSPLHNTSCLYIVVTGSLRKRHTCCTYAVWEDGRNPWTSQPPPKKYSTSIGKQRAVYTVTNSKRGGSGSNSGPALHLHPQPCGTLAHRPPNAIPQQRQDIALQFLHLHYLLEENEP